MKILVFPVLVVVMAVAFYQAGRNRKNKTWLIGAGVLLLLFLGLGVMFVDSINAPDTWCSTVHQVQTAAPINPKTASDYFNLGNYHYDLGNCSQAVVDYAKAIELQPKYPEALNNRAYTYMRMQEYFLALPDLDHALALRPDYVQALMNRGDIYNYYFINRSKAIADYQKVIALVGYENTSVCGHLFLAQHNGWNFGTILTFPFAVMNCSSSRG